MLSVLIYWYRQYWAQHCKKDKARKTLCQGGHV